MRFRWDYAGGWGKYRQGKYWTRFKNRCRPYDGPPLPMLVAACKAPNGSYWTIQAWQRRLPLLGFDPWLPHHTNWELHVAHWSGALPVLEAHPNWTYDGRWQGVFGRYSYLGAPVYGFELHREGRAEGQVRPEPVYIDTLNSAYGPGWKRESGILTHKGTGTFCHSFVPQRPFPGYPSQDMRPAAPGERHRITVGGPGSDARDAGRARGPHAGGPRARLGVQRRVRQGHGRRQELRGRAVERAFSTSG